MKRKLIFFLTLINSYKKKLFKILIYEIYFSTKYFKTGNFIKFQNSDRRTDTIPCPYYFIHKISQFINNKKITSVADLGSGYGRVTNSLSVTTNAKILGYEVDKEVSDISAKNKNNNVTIENKDILYIDYNNLKVECFIITDPFHDEADLEYLINKIGLSRINITEKYYLIIINVDEKKMHIFNNHKLLKSTFASQSRCIKFFSN